MNYLRKHPDGVDIPIRAFQQFFYLQMLKTFGFPTDDTAFDLYGRARNNPKSDGNVAEVESGSEYIDVLFNDTKKVGQGFFGVGDTTTYMKGSARAKIYLILQYTMTGITNGPYTPMHDEQVNNTIMKIVKYPKFGFTFTGLVRRVDNIFKEYPGWKDTVKFSDLYPWHVLRLEFDLLYSIETSFNCKF